MSAEGVCPGCGSKIVFRVTTTTTAVCDFCRSIVVRGGAQLELVGKTNEILKTGSALRRGLEVTYKRKKLTLAGHTQLQHELGGTWDEWLAAQDDGKYAWISEAQGRVAIMTEMDVGGAPRVRSVADANPGDRFNGPYGELVVVERGTATIVAEEGELPGRTMPGAVRPFVDFSTRDGRFATLDFGTTAADGSKEPKRFFVGREVTLAELGIAGDVVENEPMLPKAEASQALRCPKCGAPVEKKLSESESLVCTSCNSGLSIEKNGELGFLFAQEKQRYQPWIPLGRKATLDAGFFKKTRQLGTQPRPWPTSLDVEVVANVVRSVVVDGDKYTFQEHLLYAGTHGYFWLVESDAEWLFVRNLEPGLVTEAGYTAKLEGKSFPRDQQNVATVEQVLGELYYRATKGEQSQLVDYKSTPRVLSKEKTANELIWTECLMVDAGDVGRLFKVKTPSPPSYNYSTSSAEPSAFHSGDGGGSINGATAVLIIIVVIIVIGGLAMCGDGSGGGGGHYGGGGGGGFSFGK